MERRRTESDEGAGRDRGRANVRAIPEQRASLGALLREKREGRGLTLEEISRITRIPEASLQHLEEGRFEQLPADIFVRGFLRSYARCVGLDADELVKRYASCGLTPAPVASEAATRMATSIAADGGQRALFEPLRAIGQGAEASEPAARGTGSARTVGAHEPDAVSRTATAAAPSSEPQDPGQEGGARDDGRGGAGADRLHRVFLPSMFEGEDEPRRGALTVAVIILVLVATLTMSYLLRRPSSSGEGITSNLPGRAAPAGAVERASGLA